MPIRLRPSERMLPRAMGRLMKTSIIKVTVALSLTAAAHTAERGTDRETAIAILAGLTIYNAECKGIAPPLTEDHKVTILTSANRSGVHVEVTRMEIEAQMHTILDTLNMFGSDRWCATFLKNAIENVR
jgi:hypothetical protein